MKFRETNTVAPICLEDNVWISSNVTVLPGVTIGSGAVIGAGAVVTHDIPPGVLALGVPARVVRSIA
jgi:acetyltransferase-like isoleucine patch superfamily enzyme